MSRWAAALLVAVAALPAAGQAPAGPAVESVERLLSAWMAEHGIPGLSIAVARDGRIVLEGGYGLADLESFVPATPRTVYRSASIGKPLTATAAMRLAESGRLDLAADVRRYCPAFPAKRWPVTPRHLLSHVSGIRHYGGPRDVEERFSTHHYAGVVESLAPFAADPLAFEPGSDYLYSTYGYVVAGCVIEGAAGEPYLETMRELVFEPAGMTHTRDDDPAEIVHGRAAGYAREDGVLRIAPFVDMSNRLPAGGFLTTVGDLARFGAAFADCRLTSCATRDAMLAHTGFPNGSKVNYGLGWGIGEDEAGRPTGRISHGGSSPGASGILYVALAERVAVAVLTNLEGLPGREALAGAIVDAVLATSPPADAGEP